MPSTGTPSWNTACGARPVDSSYADMWLPERTTPVAPNSRTEASLTSHGWISQYTRASRTRRAMSWVYWAPKSRMRIFWCLLDSVIWRLLHDLHIMHVRLADARSGDFHELAACAQLLDRGVAGIAHACPQAADELLDHPDRAALVGDPPFDPFGDQLVHVHIRILEIPVRRAFLHRAERAHAAVGLVRAALVELDLARRLLGAGEERAEHDDVGAGGERLGDVARVAHAAVGDQRHVRLGERFGDVLDRGDLRHADSRDDAGGADRAGPDADLHAVRAVVDQRPRAVAGADVAAHHLHLRVARLDPLHAVEHALGMPVGGVDHEHVGAGFDQRGDALIGALAHADGCADAELAVRILGGAGMLALLQDVLDRHQALQVELLVHHQHALQTVLVHELHRFRAARPLAHRDELLLRRHDVLHRLVEFGLEAQVAVGDDADDLAAVLQHREAGDLVGALQFHYLPHAHLRRNGHRVAQHARLEPLHFRHLGSLRLLAEVLVDDADAAFLRDGDGEARFGHRIHRRRDERNIQLELATEPAFQGGVTRQDARVGGKEEDIVEGQRLLDYPHGSFSQSSIIRESLTAAFAPGYVRAAGAAPSDPAPAAGRPPRGRRRRDACRAAPACRRRRRLAHRRRPQRLPMHPGPSRPPAAGAQPHRIRRAGRALPQRGWRSSARRVKTSTMVSAISSKSGSSSLPSARLANW